MSQKTDTQVVIGGKVLTLSGYESAEYLQRIASYINDRLEEFERLDGYRLQPLDIRNVLMQINLADDYFKAKKQIDVLQTELQEKEKEIYDIKHELISTQMKLESSNGQVLELQNTVAENAQKIMRLETELKNRK